MKKISILMTSTVLVFAMNGYASAENFLGVKFNPTTQKNEIWEFNSETQTEAFLTDFNFPSGSWSATTAFVDPKSGLLIMPDSGGSMVVYNRQENSVTILPPSVSQGYQALFPAIQAGGTDSLIRTEADNSITVGDGSFIRTESDGSVHIGQDSIVFFDSLQSSSGNDEIFSSVNRLQLGSNSQHRTIVLGSLEIQEPTLPNHAATKNYVDNYASAVGAMAIASMHSSQNSNSNSALSIGIGIGHLNGQSAWSLGVGGYSPSANMRYSLSASYNSYVGNVAYGTGFGWNF